MTHGVERKMGNSKRNKLFLLAKKTEKLVTAIYLTTDFINDNEEIKHELRTTSLSLLDRLYNAIHLADSAYLEHIAVSITTAEKIVSLLHIAKINGYISDMNSEVLDNELHLLIQGLQADIQGTGGDLVQSLMRPNSERFSLSPQIFTQQNLEGLPKGLFKTTSINDIVSGPHPATEPRAVARKTFRKQRSSHSTADERRSIILGLMDERGEITLGDIKEKITRCSEKTIQRLLHVMIQQGEIERKGEKRWSTYTRA